MYYNNGRTQYHGLVLELTPISSWLWGQHLLQRGFLHLQQVCRVFRLHISQHIFVRGTKQHKETKRTVNDLNNNHWAVGLIACYWPPQCDVSCVSPKVESVIFFFSPNITIYNTADMPPLFMITYVVFSTTASCKYSNDPNSIHLELFEAL